MTAGVETLELTTGELMFTDGEASATKADGSGVFEGETQGMCGAPEAPGPERSSSVPVAAEKELGASEVVEFLHGSYSADPWFDRGKRSHDTVGGVLSVEALGSVPR